MTHFFVMLPLPLLCSLPMPHYLHNDPEFFLKLGIVVILSIMFIGIPIILRVYKSLSFKQGIIFNISLFFAFGLTFQSGKSIKHEAFHHPSKIWKLTISPEEKPYVSEVHLKQVRNQIIGYGVNSYGTFFIAGSMRKDNIAFRMVYDNDSMKNGATTSPIIFSGKVKNDAILSAHGKAKLLNPTGYDGSWRGPVKVKEGKPFSWQASLKNPSIIGYDKK